MDVQTVALIGASLVLVFLTLLVWAVNSRADLMKGVSILEDELKLAGIRTKKLEYDNEKLLKSSKASSDKYLYLVEKNQELMDTNRDLNNLVEDTKKSTRVAEKVALEAINDITALFRVVEEQSLEPTYIYDKIKEKYDLRVAIETGEFSMEGRV